MTRLIRAEILKLRRRPACSSLAAVLSVGRRARLLRRRRRHRQPGGHFDDIVAVLACRDPSSA